MRRTPRKKKKEKRKEKKEKRKNKQRKKYETSMKTILQTFILLLLVAAVSAQGKAKPILPDPLAKKVPTALLNNAQKEIEAFHLQTSEELEKTYLSDLKKELHLEFKTDTFAIEYLFDNYIADPATTTLGMREVGVARRDAYDILLNKYYKKLTDKASPEDKEAIREAQRAWIKFRDNEASMRASLQRHVMDESGESMAILEELDFQTNIIRNRVNQLHDYLSYYLDDTE